jgi:outer membrane protein
MRDARGSGRGGWVWARWVLAGLWLLWPGGALGQQEEAGAGQPVTLTLEEAIRIARQRNPTYLAQRNDEAAAVWGVREAWSQLFLPQASASFSLGYQASGTPRFGVFTSSDLGLSETPEYYSSWYSLGLSYRLSGATLLRPAQARAVRRAAEARADLADFELVSAVTRQYLAVLRAQDGVALARQELARAEENWRLARARVEVGAAIPLEAKQAEVERGRMEVALIEAENLERTERLRLLEQLGLEALLGSRELVLTSRLEVFEPRWTEAELIERAQQSHPELMALRAEEGAGRTALRVARSQYLPSLSLSVGWSGYTREAGSSRYLLEQAERQVASQIQSCEQTNEILRRLSPPMPETDCLARYTLTEEQRQAIVRQNDVFPFEFSREPLSAQLQISVPLFTGFAREREVEEARASAEDARHRLRAAELRLRTEVQAAHGTLLSAYRRVRLEERNREAADEQLRLATERYRLGAASFLELSEAETAKARADREHLAALYRFHDELARLERASGTRLREEVSPTTPPPDDGGNGDEQPAAQDAPPLDQLQEGTR